MGSWADALSGGYYRIMTYLLPAVDTWEQWSAIFTDLALWKPVVSEICLQEGIACGSVEAGYPGSNAVFLVDRRYAVKVYNPVWKDFGVERELLQALEQVVVVPTPKMVSSGRFADRIEWDYMITEFVEGEPLREVRKALTGDDLISVSTDLGNMVRALHRMDLADLHAVVDLHETGPKLAQRRKLEVVKELANKELLPGQVLDELTPFLEAAAAQVADDDAVLVHGDLTEDHVLLQKRDGGWEITGLLDLGDAHACPKEYEWPALWLGTLGRDPAALRAFFHTYSPAALEEAGFLERAFAWTLLHDFGTGMVEDVLKGYDGPRIDSVDQLRGLMWPDSILTG